MLVVPVLYLYMYRSNFWCMNRNWMDWRMRTSAELTMPAVHVCMLVDVILDNIDIICEGCRFL